MTCERSVGATYFLDSIRRAILGDGRARTPRIPRIDGDHEHQRREAGLSVATIGFITCSDLSRFFPDTEEPTLTHDDRSAAEALRARGHTVVPVVWGAETPTVFDVAVVRSPWDYQDSPEKSAAFFAWLEQLSTRVPVQNPLPLLRWNLDKRYLRELEEVGVPIVPTEFFEPERALERSELAARAAIHPIVLKPAVSAASRDTFLIDGPAAAERLVAHHGEVPVDVDLDAWRGDRTFLIQPFLPEIRERGEWSVVFLDGELSHAVLKRPAAGGWWVQDELGGSVVSAEPPAAIVDAAAHAFAGLRSLSVASDGVLYARVDLIEAQPPAARVAAPLVSEVELVEPELFFKRREPGGHQSSNERALSLFVRGVEARLEGVPGSITDREVRERTSR